MIRIKIDPKDVDWARKQTESFDKQKTHDKFSFNNNFIGVLGELYFHKWLNSNSIVHEWVNFEKPDYTKPDFFINNHSVDVKTSFDTKMWLQKPEWDFYVFCRVNEDLDEFFIIRFLPGKDIIDLIERGVVKMFDKGRVNNPYIVYIDQMMIMDYFLEAVK